MILTDLTNTARSYPPRPLVEVEAEWLLLRIDGGVNVRRLRLTKIGSVSIWMTGRNPNQSIWVLPVPVGLSECPMFSVLFRSAPFA